MTNAVHGFLARHLDRHVNQIADDGLDIATDITDFGKFCRLDLDERRIGELGQPARDLGFPDTGRSNHQNVLWRDFIAQDGFDLAAPPAVSQCDCHGALRRILSDDVLIELCDDLARRQFLHQIIGNRFGAGCRHQRSSSIVRFELV